MRVRPAAELAAEIAVPLLVIGAGAAGLTAALAAKERGLEVLVIERDALPGGSTALSSGLVPAPGTRFQAAAGVTDSPELFAADIMAKNHRGADPAIVALATEAIGPAIDWLAEHHGIQFGLVEGFLYPGHSALRMHGTPARSGRELMDQLLAAVERAGIDLLCSATVETLFADPDGRVEGIELARPDGSRERIGCEALLLACNGYGGNPELVRAHLPEMADALYFGHPGNQGDALLWGLGLGAAARDLGAYQGHGSVAHPHGILISWATIMGGGIQVNQAGERFSDESHGYSEQAVAVLGQPGGTAFSIFDARIEGSVRQFEDYRAALEAGAIKSADTIAGLASLLGLPEAALSATLAEVDALARGGGTDRFGRRFDAPRLAPPYRAVRVTGALFHTQGGLAIDASTRVLRPDGTPLPNLFAAGGAARGLSGATVEGYLSGNGLLSAIALGAVAGRSVLA